jgi:hypothetical protein
VTAQDSRTGKDWIAWHVAYDDDTPLHHRLLAVQRRIREALLEQPAGPDPCHQRVRRGGP